MKQILVSAEIHDKPSTSDEDKLSPHRSVGTIRVPCSHLFSQPKDKNQSSVM